MPSSLNADNGVVSGTAGLKSSADSSGVLDLQTNGTTAISISASQVVSFANQPTYTGGTANGVMFLNGSKAVTTGTALTFDGSNFATTGAGTFSGLLSRIHAQGTDAYITNTTTGKANTVMGFNDSGSTTAQGIPTGYSYYGTLQSYPIGFTSGGYLTNTISSTVHAWNTTGSEQMRLNSTGLGIGTSSPAYKLDVNGVGRVQTRLTVGSVVEAADRMFYVSGNAATSGANQFGMVLNPTYPTTPTSTIFNLYTGPNLTAGTTVTTVYGHYLEAINAAGSTVTNRWGIYQAGGSDKNVFAGNVAVFNGITFPATQVASADANTLDDYEEGAWTPALSGAGSPTYTENFGRYIKVGRLVTLTGKLAVTGATSSGNVITITGLPFAVADASDSGQRACSFISGDVQQMGIYVASAAFRTATSTMEGVRDNGSGSTVYWVYSELSSTSYEFSINVTYMATA